VLARYFTPGDADKYMTPHDAFADLAAILDATKVEGEAK
jgi:hypothetical protein